jgi:hypothetical protein
MLGDGVGMMDYAERRNETERLARLICAAMGDAPDDIVSNQNLPVTARGWQVISAASVQPGWSVYWHAATAVIADAELRAQRRKVPRDDSI